MKSFQWTKQERHRRLRNAEVEVAGHGDKLIQQQNQDQASLPLPKAMNT